VLKEGQLAPAFSALDHTGKTVALSDYAGTNLLLWFYPKADTPG
jgi:peroxiredoxin Q/BCP